MAKKNAARAGSNPASGPPRQRRSRQRNARIAEPWIRRVLRYNLRNRRVQCGYTQHDVAAFLRVTQEYVSEIESPKDHKVPSIERIQELAQCYGCTAADLMTPNRFTGYVDGDTDLRNVRVQSMFEGFEGRDLKAPKS